MNHAEDQVRQLRPDPLVDELRRLAPEINIHGGSFAHWLPPPSEVSPQHRTKLFKRLQREATEQCLMELLANAGFRSFSPLRRDSGARSWPIGYSGSLSHKGARVVAAFVPTDRAASVGIDIETLEGAQELSTISGLSSPDWLPPTHKAGGAAVTFSVKEAVFKALHPVLDCRLRFDDIAISWTQAGPGALLGSASCAGFAADVRCSVAIPSWIVSVASIPP